MNLERLEGELRLLILDKSLFSSFRQWINDAILEVATDFDLPTLRVRSPATTAITTANWVFAPPATFFKNLFQCYDSDYSKVKVCNSIDELHALDIEHTATGDHITHIAVDPADNYFCVYPRATENIYTWFYQLPTELVLPADIPTCIPAAYHERVILSKVIIKNYRILQDLIVDAPDSSLMYWQTQYREGLYGAPKGDIGMLNFFAKQQPPRRHGGQDPLV